MTRSEQLNGLVAVGGGCLIACWIFLFLNVVSGRRRPPAAIVYLGTFILYVVSGTVGLAAVGLAVYVVQKNPANAAQAARVMSYEVRADVNGHRETVADRAPSAFTASSGQLNFGCEQVASAKAVWTIPEGAQVRGSPTARWVNLDNASSYAANVSMENGVVVATGTIVGRPFDRLPFGISNCPGGGHGELIIAGEYVTRVTATEAVRTSLSGRVASEPSVARETLLTLPAVADVTIDSIVVELERPGVTDSATIATTGRREAGAESTSASGLFAISIVKCEAGDCVRVRLTDAGGR